MPKLKWSQLSHLQLGRYQTSEIWLLYPMVDKAADFKDVDYCANEEGGSVHVRFFFVDLANYKESIERLYQNVCDGIAFAVA